MLLMPILRAFWRLRPRPWYAPWRALPYYRWRIETFTGIAAQDVTWKVCLDLVSQHEHRKALRRYIVWCSDCTKRRDRPCP